MTDTPESLAARMRSEGEKTLEFFRNLPPEALEKTLYMDGSQWKVQQALAHFVVTEISIKKLLESILAGGEGVSEDFDIDRFNERKVAGLSGASLTELLDAFQTARANSASWVEQLRPDDLNIQGRHPFLGIIALSEMIKLLYRHNQIHQRDIRRLIS